MMFLVVLLLPVILLWVRGDATTASTASAAFVTTSGGSARRRGFLHRRRSLSAPSVAAAVLGTAGHHHATQTSANNNNRAKTNGPSRITAAAAAAVPAQASTIATADSTTSIMPSSRAPFSDKRRRVIRSLAGPYLVVGEITKCDHRPEKEEEERNATTSNANFKAIWSLYNISSIGTIRSLEKKRVEGGDSSDAPLLSEGAQAWTALHLENPYQMDDDVAAVDDAVTTATTLPKAAENEELLPCLVLQCQMVPSKKTSNRDDSLSSPELTLEVSTGSPTGCGVVKDTTAAGAPGTLIQILSRVLVQWWLSIYYSDNVDGGDCDDATDDEWTIRYDSAMTGAGQQVESAEVAAGKGTTTKLVYSVPKNARADDTVHSKIQTMAHHLYQDILNITDDTEIVDMVDGKGVSLAVVPRPFIHRFNLLHRGIGLFVTKDEPIQLHDNEHQQQPDLYVHQRTSTKSIFPSCFDMFVGGVSLAYESSYTTACREVAEELGLSKALSSLSQRSTNTQTAKTPMSQEPILQCIVCTAYNRCVVKLYNYVMDTTTETIKWQPEEVAWGAFVPYPEIVTSAHASIQRLVEKGQWPGIGTGARFYDDSGSDTTDGETTQWDYVPDGLLVWEAWLDYLLSRG